MVSRDPQIRIIVGALNRVSEGVVKRIALSSVAELTKAPGQGGTPVDTGWARANWIPSIGSAFTGTAGSREDAEQGQIDMSPQSSGIASIAVGYRLKQGSVFISNNVPYIQFLNDGSSRQAPSGFVQAAIFRAIEKASRFRG